MWYVYILRSKVDESYYIGVTADLRSRLKEHNSGETKSTRAKAPYQIVWYGAFMEKMMAYDFERYLKSSSGFAFRNKRLV
ncbi:MAG: GIY-YIG nuclease family protein [bacterium]|nr:GIY-YIG nuclease family protein [bacterium]